MRLYTIGVFLLAILASCVASEKDYEDAAQELCTCLSSNEDKANDVLRYAKCSAAVEDKFGIQIEDKVFDAAMKSQCSTWFDLHEMIKIKVIGSLDYE
jgi:hypothetical protein